MSGTAVSTSTPPATNATNPNLPQQSCCADLFQCIWNAVKDCFAWIAALCCPRSNPGAAAPPAQNQPSADSTAASAIAASFLEVPDSATIEQDKRKKIFLTDLLPRREQYFTRCLNLSEYSNFPHKDQWIADFVAIVKELCLEYNDWNKSANLPFATTIQNGALWITPKDQSDTHIANMLVSAQALTASESIKFKKVRLDHISTAPFRSLKAICIQFQLPAVPTTDQKGNL